VAAARATAAPRAGRVVIRVLLVDDQALVRRGLRLMLDQAEDLEVCGEAADGDEAVRMVGEQDPDVVLMDVRMPGVDGIEATRQITRQQRRARILVLTTFDVDDYVVDALRVGASGYLLKDVDPEDLLRAVRSVAAGDMPLAPPVLERVVSRYLDRRPADPRLDRLSQREREVLGLLGEGLTNAEISERLFISMPTTKTHVAAVLAKLDLRDRVQAAIFAHDQRLVPRVPRT
jgi:DNA-binding NarL/FixJ family response regulator